MELLATEPGNLTVEVLQEVGPERERCERELTEAGVPLALPNRCAWARSRPATRSWFLAVRYSRGVCRGGFALEVNRSRALPGHLLLHAERFGASLPGATRDAALAALLGMARQNRRILRVSLQVLLRQPDERAALEQALASAGFGQAPSPRRYTHTLAVDLTPPEEDILRSFSAKTRRDIRAMAKHPVRIMPIEEDACVGRMDALLCETLSRTGGKHHSRDLEGLVDMSVSSGRIIPGRRRSSPSRGPAHTVTTCTTTWPPRHGPRT